MQVIFFPLIKKFLAIWGPKIHYLAHNNPPLDPALNVINLLKPTGYVMQQHF